MKTAYSVEIFLILSSEFGIFQFRHVGFAGIILFLDAFSGHLRVFTEVCGTHGLVPAFGIWSALCILNKPANIWCKAEVKIYAQKRNPYFLLQIKKDFKKVFFDLCEYLFLHSP